MRVQDNPILSVSDGAGGLRCVDELKLVAELLKVDEETVLATAEAEAEVR